MRGKTLRFKRTPIPTSQILPDYAVDQRQHTCSSQQHNKYRVTG